MKPNLATILSFNGGYVDTAGFLALQGLFVAHVTGNFVTIGAAMTQGSSGIIAKLLVLPVFCLTVIATRYAMLAWPAPSRRSLMLMLAAMFVFLAAGGASAIHFGRFTDPDGAPLIATGMLLVIALAIQNAAHRIHLGSSPPSTLMTGTTTQIMIELANLLHGGTPKTGEPVGPRVLRLLGAVLSFAIGCALAALAYIHLGMWCFALPPLMALAGMASLALEPAAA